MFKKRRRLREDEEWDISRIIPKVEILNRSRVGARDDVVQDDGMPDQVRHDEGGREDDFVERFSVDLEERLKCNMGQVKEDATMLEKLINNKL